MQINPNSPKKQTCQPKQGQSSDKQSAQDKELNSNSTGTQTNNTSQTTAADRNVAKKPQNQNNTLQNPYSNPMWMMDMMMHFMMQMFQMMAALFNGQTGQGNQPQFQYDPTIDPDAPLPGQSGTTGSSNQSATDQSGTNNNTVNQNNQSHSSRKKKHHHQGNGGGPVKNYDQQPQVENPPLPPANNNNQEPQVENPPLPPTNNNDQQPQVGNPPVLPDYANDGVIDYNDAGRIASDSKVGVGLVNDAIKNYNILLGRAPESQGVVVYHAQRAEASSYRDGINGFITSPEFASRFGLDGNNPNASGAVDTLYQLLLGRSHAGGEDGAVWDDLVKNSADKKAAMTQVLDGILNSNEYRGIVPNGPGPNGSPIPTVGSPEAYAWRMKIANDALNGPPAFNETEYLSMNPDVALAVYAGLIPSGFEHYKSNGYAEGRSPNSFDMPFFPSSSAELTNAKREFIVQNALTGNPVYFDAAYYLGKYPDVAQTWTGTPLEHYQQYGSKPNENRVPNKLAEQFY